MIHRHLDHPCATPVDRLGAAAVDDLLDRGDLAARAPLAREIVRRPWGAVADRVLELCEAHTMYGVSLLWPAFIRSCRASDAGAPLSLGALRRAAGMSQAAVGERLGMNQSEVSRLERRADVRVSTLRAFVSACGARLRLVALWPGREGREPRSALTVAGDGGAARREAAR